MKPHFVILIMVTVAAVVGFGTSETQAEPADSSRRDLGLYFAGGMTVRDVDGLNRVLVENGYSEFDEKPLAFGVGIVARRGRLVIGAEIVQSEKEEISNSQFNAGLYGVWFRMYAGYGLHSSGGLIIYPHVGIGFARTYLSFSERTTFGEIVEASAAGSDLCLHSGTSQVGIGIDYFIGVDKRKGGVSGTVLGLRAGYCFALYTHAWTLYGNEIPGGPGAIEKGPFVHLTLGFSLAIWK